MNKLKNQGSYVTNFVEINIKIFARLVSTKPCLSNNLKKNQNENSHCKIKLNCIFVECYEKMRTMSKFSRIRYCSLTNVSLKNLCL